MSSAWSVPPADPLTLGWLRRLRWASVVGQLAAVYIAVRALQLDVSLPALLGIVSVSALTNLAATVWRTPPGWMVPALLVADTLLLTALLGLTGGPSNPFSALYLSEVALAAVTLGPAWTWTVAALAGAGYASLFFFGDPHLLHRGGAEVMQGHLFGMWVALVLTGGTISAFVARLAAGIRERDAQLLAERQRSGRAERLAALGTLAAGAAHELGSPLGVILVTAEEAQRSAKARGEADLAGDFGVIREQVDRCRAILNDLARQSGVPRGEVPERLDARTLCAGTLALLSPGERDRVRVEAPTELELELPCRTTTRVIASLLRNALAAAPGPVEVRVVGVAGATRISVVDHGVGMDEATLARAGEPFFTTRPTGEGQGLGLFVARGFAEQLGGQLLLESGPGRGTTATLVLPRGAR